MRDPVCTSSRAPLSAAQLVGGMGWSPAAIYRAVDREIVQPRHRRSGGCSWWEFEPRRGFTWGTAAAEVRHD